MVIKVLFLVVLVLLYFFLASKDGGKKTYYFLTVFFYCIRELDIPLLGSTTPGTFMAYVLFIGTLSGYKGYLNKWSGYVISILVAIIIGFIGDNPDNTPDRIMTWASNLFVVMVLALTPQSLFKSEDDLVTLTRCVLGACTVYSVTTIMGYLGFADGTVIYGGDIIDSADFHSSRSYGISPNNLIQTISVTSIPLIAWAQIKKKWMEYAIFLIFLFAATITLKRMSFIAMIPSVLYFSYYLKHTNRNFTILIIAIVIAAIMTAFWEPISYRFEIAGFGNNEIEDSSTETRLGRNAMALAAFKQSPIWGKGAGYYIYIHNGFYEILCNCGLMGILFIFLKYIPSFKSIFRLNPWAWCQIVFLITCFSLESAVNHSQLMAFMGFYLAGYYYSKQYNWSLR